MNRPLAGLTVLDLSRVFSGPYATLLLADLGARVIKVEHPAGGDDSRSFGPFVDGESAYFQSLNRGKESITIDLSQPPGQDLVRRLAARVDILVENFRPGRMDRLGLGYARLSRANPGLVFASISGFGQSGPMADRACYDIVAQAEGGLMGLTGTPELPIKTGPALADAVGGLTATVGLLAALWQRERSGRGARIDVAMVDALFALLEGALPAHQMTGRLPGRLGNGDAFIAPFDGFQAACGRWLVVAAGNDRLWRALAGVVDTALMEDPRFMTNAERVANRAALAERLQSWCRGGPIDELLARLHAAGVPAGAVRDIGELANDARLEARGMLAWVELSGGQRLQVPGSPILIDGQGPPIGRAPRLGEHSAAVLDELLGAPSAGSGRRRNPS